MRWKLEESSTGGGSDGNFTSALGVPTLDGLGALGEGAHALNESVVIRGAASAHGLTDRLNPKSMKHKDLLKNLRLSYLKSLVFNDSLTRQFGWPTIISNTLN